MNISLSLPSSIFVLLFSKSLSHHLTTTTSGQHNKNSKLSCLVVNGSHVNLAAVTFAFVILMPRLTSQGVNVPPKQLLPPTPTIETAPSLCPRLSTAQNNCGWFQEIRSSQSVWSAVCYLRLFTCKYIQ